MRIWPRSSGCSPASAWASVVLPAPEGPISPSDWPGFSARVMSSSTGSLRPGSATVAPSTDRRPSGAGRGSRSGAWSRCASRVFSRPWATRALRKARQPEIDCSTGAAARPSRIEAAIISPGDSWLLITSTTPTPSTAICSPMRTALASEVISATRSVANVLNTSAEKALSCQRRIIGAVLPMAWMRPAFCIISATAALVSVACFAAVSIGLRAMSSFSSASVNSTAMPTSATSPSTGLNRKISARKTSDQGASSSARNTGLVTKPRRSWMSRIGSERASAGGSRVSIMPSSTAGLSRASRRDPSRATRRWRIMSNRKKNTSAIAAPVVRAIKVGMLPEAMTRANSCSM